MEKLIEGRNGGHIQRATLEDCALFMPKIREQDRKECEAFIGLPVEAVLPGMVISQDAYSIVALDGRLLAMFGVAPSSLCDGAGLVWLLASDDLRKYALSFLENVPTALEMLHEKYPILWNYVWAENELHHKWLKWAGFVFVRQLDDWGYQKRSFYEVVRVHYKEE